MKIQRNQPNTQKPHLPRLCIADVGLMAAITVIMTAVLATSHLVPMTYLLLMVAVYLGITVGVFFLSETGKDVSCKLQVRCSRQSCWPPL